MRHSAADFVVLAKAESAKEVHDAGWLMAQAGAGDDRDAAGGARRRRDRAGDAPA